MGLRLFVKRLYCFVFKAQFHQCGVCVGKGYVSVTGYPASAHIEGRIWADAQGKILFKCSICHGNGIILGEV